MPKDPQEYYPKYGKLDPTGKPHVGGNTWAGGTGKNICLFRSLGGIKQQIFVC